MKNIYTYIENNYKNINKNSLIDKIILFEEKFKHLVDTTDTQLSQDNELANQHMDMDDDDESICLQE